MSERLSVQVSVGVRSRNEQALFVDCNCRRAPRSAQAIEASGILQRFPRSISGRKRSRVFGKLKPLDTVLADHDRVEIYRPLLAGPEACRANAASRRPGR